MLHSLLRAVLNILLRAVLHSLWRDPLLGALVVVRVAAKFELPAARLAKAMGLYRSAQRQRELLALENRVVEALPARHTVAANPLEAEGGWFEMMDARQRLM